jgi:hypothetical protein
MTSIPPGRSRYLIQRTSGVELPDRGGGASDRDLKFLPFRPGSINDLRDRHPIRIGEIHRALQKIPFQHLQGALERRGAFAHPGPSPQALGCVDELLQELSDQAGQRRHADLLDAGPPGDPANSLSG